MIPSASNGAEGSAGETPDDARQRPIALLTFEVQPHGRDDHADEKICESHTDKRPQSRDAADSRHALLTDLQHGTISAPAENRECDRRGK